MVLQWRCKLKKIKDFKSLREKEKSQKLLNLFSDSLNSFLSNFLRWSGRQEFSVRSVILSSLDSSVITLPMIRISSFKLLFQIKKKKKKNLYDAANNAGSAQLARTCSGIWKPVSDEWVQIKLHCCLQIGARYRCSNCGTLYLTLYKCIKNISTVETMLRFHGFSLNSVPGIQSWKETGNIG